MVKIDYTEVRSVKLKAEDQEISINKIRNEDCIEIYCSDNTYLTKILKQIKKHPEGWECFEAHRNEDGPTGYIFKAPKKCLCIRATKEKKGKKEVSEDFRKVAGERFKQMWATKLANK